MVNTCSVSSLPTALSCVFKIRGRREDPSSSHHVLHGLAQDGTCVARVHVVEDVLLQLCELLLPSRQHACPSFTPRRELYQLLGHLQARMRSVMSLLPSAEYLQLLDSQVILTDTM